VISADEKKREELGRRYGIESVGPYEDFEKLVREAGAEAVYLSVPNHLHREWTERAARERLHVLCEKPMALTPEDCETMILATQTAGVKLMIAYRLHFEEANLEAIDLVRSGRIGDPVVFSAVLTQTVREGDIRTRAELGGGALFDEGPYCVNAARYLFGAEPTEVFAFDDVSEAGAAEADDTTIALMRFPGGQVASFVVSQDTAETSAYRLIGRSGELRLDPAFGYQGERRLFLTAGGKTAVRTFPARDQFAPELLYFSQCIRDGAEPEPSGEEGLADVRVLVALRTSARERRPVSLPPFERRRRPQPNQVIVRPAARPPPTVNAPSPSK
jgi:predicted dehydrogenase